MTVRSRLEHRSGRVGASPGATRSAWESDGFELRAHRLVTLGVDARVRKRALGVLKKRLLALLEGGARNVERDLRGRDNVRGRLHVGRDLFERTCVDLGEANVGEVMGEEIEDGLNGKGNRVHKLNI